VKIEARHEATTHTYTAKNSCAVGAVDYHSVHGLYDLVVAGVRSLVMLLSLRVRDRKDGHLKWEVLWHEGERLAYVIQPANGWSITGDFTRVTGWPLLALAHRRNDIIEFAEVLP
jgi:hypothetical protein